MDGSFDQKIVVTDPLKVRDNRGRFTSAHEADINFIQRFLIDTGILSCFKTDSQSRIIPYNLLEPVNKVILPHVIYMDIEVKTQGRFPNARNPTAPVVSVSFFDSFHKRYLTICADDRVIKEVVMNPLPDWIIMHVPTPTHLLGKVIEYLNYMNPDIVTGWNIEFDINYLEAWANSNFHKHIPVGESGEVFDLLEAYRKIRGSLGNRLKEVVVREGILHSEDMVSEFFKVEMYNNRNTRDDFILYNKKDVEYCVKLDTGFKRVTDGKWIQYDLISNFWAQRNFVGLHTINYTTSHVKRHDPLWLRMAHQLGFTLPMSGTAEDDSGLDEGAVVFTPDAGIYRDITVLDMSRYYPSILLSFPKETSPDIWGKLAPAVISYLSAERDKWDAELKKHTPGTQEYNTVKLTQTVVKHFLSGAWGYFAYSGSRIYSKERGDFVLRTGAEGLDRVRSRALKIGHKTIYGDTDSILIHSKPDEVDNLVDEVNDELSIWAGEKGIVDSRFHIKEDRFAKTTLFIEKKGTGVGAKKRYGQRIVREGGEPCDYILVKGFEYVRGNTSEVTRKLQKEVIDDILMDNITELTTKIKTIMDSIKSNKYSLDDITIPINLSQPFTEKKVSGEYYNGAIWNNMYIGESIIPGDLVRYFKAKSTGSLPHNEWVSYLEQSAVTSRGVVPDYDWIINRTLRSPLERILASVGISWDHVEGYKDVDDLFR